MFKNKTLLLIILIVILLIGAYFIARQPLFKPNLVVNNNTLPPKVEVSTPQVLIKDQTFDVVVADDIATQRKGLDGQSSLGSNQGMLFIYTDPRVLTFWMKDMKFSVDLLWIKGDQVEIGRAHV